jgi:dolichol-phosphate mannosyltransferase
LGNSSAFCELDVTDTDATRRLVRDVQPEWVFSLAAYGNSESETDPTRCFEVNVLGTQNLLDAAAGIGVESFVHAGSSSEYGPKEHAPSEHEPLEPTSVYGATKAAATILCSWNGRVGRVPASVLRLYSAYGPWEHPSRLVPRLLRHATRGTWPPLVAPGTSRDFVYIGDVVEAFVRAAEGALAGAVFNVASGRRSTVGEVVEIVQRQHAVAQQPRWNSMTARGWDVPVWVGNPARIRAALGWVADTSLEDGLARTAKWLRERPDLAAIYDAE